MVAGKAGREVEMVELTYLQLALLCFGVSVFGALAGFFAAACCVVASEADERMGRDS